MEQVIVGMGECRIGEPGQVLATFALGSCIGLAVHDPEAKIGGLLHFMLPDSALDPARAIESPYVFADTGIRRMFQQMYGRGATRGNLMVHAAGGAQLMDAGGILAIGRKNYLAMRRHLWDCGVPLYGEAIGGTNSRTLKMDVGSGRVWLIEAGSEREVLRTPGRKEAPGCARNH